MSQTEKSRKTVSRPWVVVDSKTRATVSRHSTAARALKRAWRMGATFWVFEDSRGAR